MRVGNELLLLFIAGNIFNEGNCRSPFDDSVLQAACSLECSDEPCWTNCTRTPRKIRDKRQSGLDTRVLFPRGNFSVENPPDIPTVTDGSSAATTSGSRNPITMKPNVDTIVKFDHSESEESNGVTVATLSGDVHSPSATEHITSAPLPVENLAAVRVGDSGTVEVSWNPGGSGTQYSYKLSYYVVEKQTGVPKSLIVNHTKVTLDDLLPGWNYSISVQAISNKAESTESMIHLVTQPASPTSIDLRSVERGLIVSWKVDPKSRQEKFDIEIRLTSEATFHLKNSTTATNVHLIWLYPGDQYEIRVIAISYGIKSRPVSQIQVVEPCPPRNFYIEKVWSNRVLVRWELIQLV